MSTINFDVGKISAFSGKKIEETDSGSDWSSSEDSLESDIDADASPPSSPRAAIEEVKHISEYATNKSTYRTSIEAELDIDKFAIVQDKEEDLAALLGAALLEFPSFDMNEESPESPDRLV